MASVISILISARARTGAAFAQARADLARLTATVRLSARRWIASVIARGGLGAVIAANLRTAMAHVRSFASRMPASIRSAMARAGASVARFARSIGRLGGQFLSLAGSTISAMAPMILLAGKIALVAVAVATLSGVLGNLLGVIQLVAPAAIAGGAAMVVFKMALNGVGDALKAGMDGDVEAFQKELKKLSPTARQAVLTMLDLRHEWKRTQKEVQNRFFMGFRDDIIAVSRAVQPVADRWLPKMADAFAAARLAIRQVITESAKSGQLDSIMGNVTKFFQNLIMVVQPLAKAFLNVAEVAGPKFAKLGEVIANLGKSFRDWIQGAKDSGKLTQWLDKAWDTFGKLWQVVKNLGSALAGIFKASSEGGDSFLDNLVAWTAALSEWVNSGDGQQMIEIFSKVISALSQSAPVFSLFLDYLKMLVTWWGLLWAAGKAAWDGIVEAAKFCIMWILNGYGLLVNGAAKAFGWMPGIGPKLKAAAAEFNAFRDQVNNSLNGIKKTVDIYVNYRARYIGNHLVRGDEQSGEYRGGGGRAHGGMASGLILAGERGPEIIDMGAAGGRVHNNGATQRMLNDGGGGNVSVGVVFGTPAAGNHLANAALEEIRTGRLPLKVTIGGKTHRVKAA